MHIALYWGRSRRQRFFVLLAVLLAVLPVVRLVQHQQVCLTLLSQFGQTWVVRLVVLPAALLVLVRLTLLSQFGQTWVVLSNLNVF
jgi:isoprenylcysteine carboxyl methyltransferase (ICMT) family protein YpbQ